MRRLFFLLTLVAVAWADRPVSAQGIYVQSGTGVSVSYARATASATIFGRRFTSSTDAVSAAVEAVSQRTQVAVGVSYSRPFSGVDLYGLSVNVGYLALHQHGGDAATLALNGGLGATVATGEGLTDTLTPFVVLGPELGVAFPVGPGVEIVPSGTVALAVPVAVEGASTSTAFGGAVGLSIRSGAARLVFQPGYAVTDGVSTISFSVKAFSRR